MVESWPSLEEMLMILAPSLLFSRSGRKCWVASIGPVVLVRSAWLMSSAVVSKIDFSWSGKMPALLMRMSRE